MIQTNDFGVRPRTFTNPRILRTYPALGEGGLAVLEDGFRGLPIDPFCTGGYRHRACSRFDCSRLASSGQLRPLPRVPLFQSSEFNPLPGYGGVVRDYPDLAERLVRSEALRRLALAWMSMIPARLRTLSVHQIRTTAPGEPVPEGRHRDGNDWVGLFVVARHGIAAESGRTRVWNLEDQVVFEGVVQPGELVTFDDRLTQHDTTPVIARAEADGPAYRDVFVFSSPDHQHYIKDAPT
jgi:hypothetical protein